ncbi:HNH endonuclease family protein [Streptomyces noursei]|uniref:HNH endonuclease family protein n=1 Tax=Streptomyces noursei TaxID=1971 RepID=UPI0023DAE562|nr:HNH endonuclease family protein [Streptomyces noursei]
MLTAISSKLSNQPFERKQDLLQGSHLEMNRRIAATERWGAKEIRARADDLALLVSGADDDQTDGEDTAQHSLVGQGEETRAEQFFRQLATGDSLDTVEAVRALFARWDELGGWIGYGARHVITNAFLMLGAAGAPGRHIWPLALCSGSGAVGRRR